MGGNRTKKEIQGLGGVSSNKNRENVKHNVHSFISTLVSQAEQQGLKAVVYDKHGELTHYRNV